MGLKCLIVHNEAKDFSGIKGELEKKFYDVDVSFTSACASKRIENMIYDFLIIESHLKDGCGIKLCQDIRAKYGYQGGIVVLNDEPTEDLVVVGIQNGADDLIKYSKNSNYMLAKFNAVERVRGINKMVYRNGDVTINLLRRTVSKSGESISLTNKEFALLTVFMQNKGRLLTRDFLHENAFYKPCDPHTNLIDVYVNHLRKKIESKVPGQKMIQTQSSEGYLMVDMPSTVK